MIYFIQMGLSGPIKIGFTGGETPQERLCGLQTGCPWPLRLMGTTKGEPADETRLHQTFKHLRTYGEWFLPARDLLDFILPIVGEQPIATTEDCLPVHDILNSLPTPLYQMAVEIASENGVTVADVLIEAVRDGLKAAKPRWDTIKRGKPARQPILMDADFEARVEFFLRLMPVPTVEHRKLGGQQ